MEKIKVIIADDSDFVRDGMRIILDVDDDFDVLGCAANGKEAIALAEKGKPDVFLMDIQMPEMDGYAATRAIRSIAEKEIADIPIIAMTANAFTEDVHEAENAGMDGHIPKPIDISVMKQTITDVLIRHKRNEFGELDV